MWIDEVVRCSLALGSIFLILLVDTVFILLVHSVVSWSDQDSSSVCPFARATQLLSHAC